MKLPFQWFLVMMFMFSAAVPCYAQEATGLHVYIKNDKAPPVMTLVPGVYIDAGQGAMQGNTKPRAYVLLVSQVDGADFSGTFEIISFDEYGHPNNLS